MKSLIYAIPRTVIECYSDFKWLWHILAISLTFILVVTNVDWYWYINTRSTTLYYIFFPAVVIGGILPLIVPLYLIIVGYFTKKRNIEFLGYAIGEAAIIGSIISSFYKIFTGRLQPNLFDVIDNITKSFQFGFWQHGVFWGWPSSHTTIAFAMAFTLVHLFPKNKTMKVFSILYAVYIGIGVSFYIHWLSDCIAGAIFGYIIGNTVGKKYKDKL
jgi:membrane-associated phospholipid phosphatase